MDKQKTGKEHFKKEKVFDINTKFMELYNLKEKNYKLQSRSREWELKANGVVIDREEGREYTHLGLCIKLQKDAEIMASIPEYNFIPLDKKGVVNRRFIKEDWKYWWYYSGTDKVVNDSISSCTTNGTGVHFEGIKYVKKNVKVPKIEYKEIDGVNTMIIKSENKVKVEYNGIYCENIPFRNFFINGTDMENSTEAIVVRYYDKNEYISLKEFDNRLKSGVDLDKLPVSYSYISETTGGDYIGSKETDNQIVEVEYWNSAKDEYKVYANGECIIDTFIPYEHKELPFALFIDNKAEGRIYGIGEFELSADDEMSKDNFRNLLIKGVKASIGFLIKERESDLDVLDLEYGFENIYEVDDIENIKHFTPNINLQGISSLESLVDDDTIPKVGVDYKGLLLAPEESATRTANRSNSIRKRINRNIKDNAYGFFTRLAKLRMSNMHLLHSTGEYEIPIEGGEIGKDGIFKKDEAGAYGLFNVTKDFTEGKYMVLPIIESMTGDSQQVEKDNFYEFSQIFGNIKDDNGANVIKGKQLVKIGADMNGYDFERLTEDVNTSKDPREIVRSNMGGDLPQTPGENQLDNPNYIPAEQRSGANDGVKTISGQAKIRPNE